MAWHGDSAGHAAAARKRWAGHQKSTAKPGKRGPVRIAGDKYAQSMLAIRHGEKRAKEEHIIRQYQPQPMSFSGWPNQRFDRGIQAHRSYDNWLHQNRKPRR